MSKRKTKSKNDSKIFFDSLTRNAIDFIEKSIEELDRSPKYSLIHFYSAIELFIKARLLVEHWSLIVSKPEQANVVKFNSGDFQSVSMQEAVKRLKNISSETIKEEAEAIFEIIGNHRNKLVHFFHSKYQTIPDKVILEEVIREQYIGWYYLHLLISNQWKSVFEAYQDEIERLNHLMHRHKEFLSAKFNEIREDIEREQKDGVKYTVCIRCNFLASRVDESNDPIFSCKCLVCNMRHNFLIFICPKCGIEVQIEDLGVGKCKNCGFKSDLDFIMTELGPSEDPKEESVKAYCANCTCIDQPTVIPFHGIYLCLNCLSFHDQPERCDWCNEFVAGMNLLDSYQTGCVMCEGHGEWKG